MGQEPLLATIRERHLRGTWSPLAAAVCRPAYAESWLRGQIGILAGSYGALKNPWRQRTVAPK